MSLGRRDMLKLAAGAVVMGSGCSRLGPVGSGSWLFEPGRLTAAHNKFFARVDYGTVYEVVDEQTDLDPDEIATPAGSIDPEELDEFAAVGSVSVSGDNGLPTGLLASGASGSFGIDVLEDLAEDNLDAEAAGTAGGFDLFSVDNPSPVESSELSLTPETFALGVREGDAVGGSVVAPEAETESKDVVEAMASAKNGALDPRTYLTDDGDYRNIRGSFDDLLGGSPTFMYGALVDPALVTLSTAAVQIGVATATDFVPGGGGIGEAYSTIIDTFFSELAAGGVAGRIDRAAGETTVVLFLTYNTASDAEQTGLVQLYNAVGAAADTFVDIEVDARYAGRNVAVRMTGETEAIFEQSEQSGVPAPTPTPTPRGFESI